MKKTTRLLIVAACATGAVLALRPLHPIAMARAAVADMRRPPQRLHMPIPQPGAYPAKGTAVQDPLSGFRVTRAADASELLGDHEGHRSRQSIVVYSRFTPVNTTGEFVLVHGDNSTSAWVVRVRDLKAMAVLRFQPARGADSRALGEVNELRWDYTGQHPNRLYFVGRSIGGPGPSGENVGMSFYSTEIDPATGEQKEPVLLHDFSREFPGLPGAAIMNDVEGDSSNESRWWAWQVMDTSIAKGWLPHAVFSYDRVNDRVAGSLMRDCARAKTPCVAVDTPATPRPYLSRPNMVEMSPRGTRVVVHWGRAYAGNREADTGSIADGPKAFRPDFSEPIRIGADETHSGWAWGLQGEELFVSQNNRNDQIEAVDIRNAGTAGCSRIAGNSFSCGLKVLPYGTLDGGRWTLGLHFGKVYDPAKRGWLFMSTYDKADAGWASNQNLLVEVNDGTRRASRIRRLGPTYNLYRDYRSEGAGALDFRAENVWTTANWGFTDGRGDVFRVQLGSAWPMGVER